MIFQLPNTRSTNDLDFFLGFGFKVGSMALETIELGKEGTDAQAAKRDHTGLHALGRNISEASSSH